MAEPPDVTDAEEAQPRESMQIFSPRSVANPRGNPGRRVQVGQEGALLIDAPILVDFRVPEPYGRALVVRPPSLADAPQGAEAGATWFSPTLQRVERGHVRVPSEDAAVVAP